MPSKPDIKDIIGSIFISPLTDIIYEYAKCYYCSYILQKLSTTLENQYKIEVNTYTTCRVVIRIRKSPICGKYNLYTLYDSEPHRKTGQAMWFGIIPHCETRQNFCEEDVDASLEQTAYFLAHVPMIRLYNAHIDKINVVHTDTPTDVDWTKGILLRRIGIDTNIFLHNKK